MRIRKKIRCGKKWNRSAPGKCIASGNLIKYNMKSALKHLSIILLTGLTAVSTYAQRDDSGRDRTQSPYFEIPGKRGETETLPLLSTSADVNIAGVIADVKVRQVYVNRGKTPIEASYIFPLSTRAAVYGMQFTLGKRVVKAEIQEKEKALQTYNEAKSEGKTAGLVQQHRPNVFQMNLANIMPGDTINVDLFYTELVMSENGVYEFVYPTVVGPRYTEDVNLATNTPNENWVGNPYTSEGKNPTYLFDIKAKINAGVPLQEATCTSHDVNVNFLATSVATVDLKSTDKVRGNKDFILKYRLTGNKIQEGVLCYEGEKENYFLMMLQPPKTVTRKELPAREYIFIMDISGSQSGFPIEVSKVLMKNLLQGLKPEDRFNVLLFAGSSAWLSDSSLVASPENIQRGVDLVSQQRGGGSTNLLGALQKAMTFKKTPGYSRTFAISTDGYITVEKETFQYVKDNLGEANFFTFGIGSSVNRYLIEGLAHAGMGEPFVVTKQSEADPAAEKFRNYIENPVLTNIKVNYSGFNAYDLVPLQVPDVFALRPIIVFGKYKGSPSGSISVSGVTGAGKYSTTLDVGAVKAEKSNSALKYLWARHKIREYDFAGKIGNSVKAEITKLGLEYGLLTDYTSFVAVDSEVRNKTGRTDSIVQPLPLPEGVSNNALGTYGVAGKTNGYFNSNSGYSTVTGTTAPAPLQQTVSGGSNGQVTVNHSYNTQGRYQAQTVVTMTDKKSSKKVETLKAEKEMVRTHSSGKGAKDNPAEKSGDNSVQNLEESPIYTGSVQESPEFPGGQSALLKFLKDNVVYPATAKDQGIQGKVFVRFTVTKDGTIKNIQILKSPHKSLSEETLRVLKLMPKWTPAKANGKAIDMEYTLPVNFKL